MQKLNTVIAGLRYCINPNTNCEVCDDDCPYLGKRDGHKVCVDFLMEDALVLLKRLFADLVHANDEILARERTENELNVEIVSLRLKASDYERKCVIARKERDEARMKVLRLEAELFKLRQMPNDWGEYPPEFPREGM